MGTDRPVRYAHSNGVDVAYRVIGDGPIDVVFVPGWISNIDVAWELPEFARFLDRLASFSRLIIFDKRGTGLSDRVTGDVTLEERSDDVRAVMDAAGSERAALIGWFEAGAIVANFAATYPGRTRALVVGCFTAKAKVDETQPWGIEPDLMGQIAELATERWGTGEIAELLAPSIVGDERFLDFWRRYERVSASPNAAATMIRWNLEIDLRAVLPAIRVPTLVLHRSDVRLVPARAARYVAEQIPDARYVELPGADLFPFVGDSEAILDAIQEFLTGTPAPPDGDRMLATAMFTDIVSSTERADELGDVGWRDLLDAHRVQVRRLLERYGGREVDTAGDGFFAVFDGPARAVRCAAACCAAARDLGLEIRSGLHVGEVNVSGAGVTGIAVHIGARVAALAGPSEVLVTSTVKELVLGSGIAFTDRGTHALKGVREPWHLYAAVVD